MRILFGVLGGVLLSIFVGIVLHGEPWWQQFIAFVLLYFGVKLCALEEKP